MYPEDRVLVGVMPSPRDFELARAEHWYRVPREHAPKGIHAEYVAFYFTKAFGEDLRWAIHFYARRTGHELLRRCDLEAAVKRVERKLNLTGQAILCPYAEVGMDVDKPNQLEILRADLANRAVH